MSNTKRLALAEREVRRVRETSTIFATVDQFRPLEALLLAAIEELSEVLEAYEHDASPAHISDEIRDGLVYALSWYQMIKGYRGLPNTIESVNGFGKHSSAIESTQGQLLELAESPNPMRKLKDFYRILSQICSIGLHSPEGEKVFSHFHLTVNKVLANYPPEIFNTVNLQTMREVSEETILAFFEHLLRAMRIIRRGLTKGERPLTKRDWVPHYRLIMDWQNSPAALAKLEQAVLERVDEVRESGIAVAGPETTRKVMSSKESGTLPRETIIYQAGWQNVRPQ